MLLGGASVAGVARNLKISESTIWRWLSRADFQSRFRALRRQMVETAIAELQSLASEAVQTLKRNLASGNAPSEVRSAVSIIRQSLDSIEVFDHAERIKALEKRFEK